MKKIIVVAILLIGLGLAGCSQNSASNDSADILRFGLMPATDSVPIVLAQSEGYFEKYGVQVELISFSSAKDRDAALQAGELDGVITDLVALGLYNEAGFEVVATGATDGSFSLMTDENTSSVFDLKGQDVLVSNHTALEYFLDQLLEEAGLTGEAVNKTEVSAIPARLELLRNGRVGAAVLPEPWVTLGLDSGLQEIASTRAMGLNPFISAFRAEAIEQKFQEIQRFYQAYDEAVDDLNAHNIEDYIDVVIEEAGFPEEVRGKISFASFTKNTPPKESDFDSVFAWSREQGLVTENFAYIDLVLFPTPAN